MRLSTTRRAWARWQLAAGPWQGWSVCPALLAPGAADITPRHAPRPAAERIAASLKDTLQQYTGGTAIVLDLEPVLAVHIAARVNELSLAHAVLLLPPWPYRQAILPADEVLDGLVHQAPPLTAG